MSVGSEKGGDKGGYSIDGVKAGLWAIGKRVMLRKGPGLQGGGYG